LWAEGDVPIDRQSFSRKYSTVLQDKIQFNKIIALIDKIIELIMALQNEIVRIGEETMKMPDPRNEDMDMETTTPELENTESILDGRALNDIEAKKEEDITIEVLQKNLIGKVFGPTLLGAVSNEDISLIKCVYDSDIIPIGSVIMSVRKKGGRGKNMDIEINYKKNDICYTVNLEIKTSKKKRFRRIEDCPQVLSLAEKDESFKTDGDSYAKFFYNKHLRNLNLSFKEPFMGELPSEETYLKYVYNSDYSKHSWFEHAKNHSKSKSPSSKIVNASIGEYMESNYKNFDIVKIVDRVRSTQIGKEFLLKNKTNGEWTHDRFEESDFIIGDRSPEIYIYNNKSLVIQLPNSKIICLLRWKNHLGVLYPSYQIKLVRQR
jgi:hypothetical protein